MEPPPPPPPPHGSNTQSGPRTGGLPDGKYDIFVIPPSSAGSGFLYLPSLQVQRNSFLAGSLCTALVFFAYQTMVPVLKEWLSSTVNGGGSGVLILMVGVGVVSWAFGKTQGEGTQGPADAGNAPGSGNARARPHSSESAYTAPPPPPPPSQADPPPTSPPPKSSWQRPQPGAKPNADGKSSWEKAREETRKREEQKRREEEIKRRREELEKERLVQREKETRERLERELKEKREREEKERKEKEERDKRERDQKERLEKLERERAERMGKAANTSPRKPPGPTARTERDDDAYSFRPYDRPKKGTKGSGESVYSEESYAPSATTAKTTPPPSTRGPYTTKDPDKVIIKAVYSFNNAFLRTPIAQLVSGQGQVTDGLILRITTEGLFIDDDVRGVPQREWDVKAWTMKLAETCDLSGMCVLRASIRDHEGKRYVFILSQSEAWKVAIGLQRLRKGSQVRALGVAGLPQNEAKLLLETLGWTS